MAANIIAIYDVVWMYSNEQHEPQGTITITPHKQRNTTTPSISPSKSPKLLCEKSPKNSEIQNIDFCTYCLIRDFDKLIKQAETKFKEVENALEGGVGMQLPAAAEVMTKIRKFSTGLLSPSRSDLDEDGNDSKEGDSVDEPDSKEDDENAPKEDIDNQETIYRAVLKYSDISATFDCEPADDSNHSFKNFNEIKDFIDWKGAMLPRTSSAQITSMNMAKDSNDFLFLKFIIFKTGIDSPIIGFAKRRPSNTPKVTDAEIDGILEEEYAVTLQEDVDKLARAGVSDDGQWNDFKMMEGNIEKSKVELEGKEKENEGGDSWSLPGADTFELGREGLLENVDEDQFKDGDEEEEKEDEGNEILVPLVRRSKDRFLLDEDDLTEDDFPDFGVEDEEENQGDEEKEDKGNEDEEDEDTE